MSEAVVPAKELPDCVARRLASWKSLFIFHSRIHYLLGIVGVLASSLAALSIDQYYISRMAAVLSAVIFGVIGFVHPDQEYTKFVNAWRILDAACSKYRYDLLSLEDLLAAKDRGEDVIGGNERVDAMSGRKQDLQPHPRC